MTKDEALREAIDTLKSTKHGNCDFAWIDETLKKCTEALAQPVQEPVTWDKPSDNFNEWWDSNYEDPANPFEKDSAAWWAWAGWKAAQTVQKPVAWLYPEGLKALQNGKCWTAYPTQHEDCNTPLYIAMPPMPVQEPVAWVCMNGEKHDIDFDQPEIDAIPVGTFLYTTPPQRPWVGLTEQDMPSGEDPMFDHQYFIAGMVYAAKVLKEKNT